MSGRLTISCLDPFSDVRSGSLHVTSVLLISIRRFQWQDVRSLTAES